MRLDLICLAIIVGIVILFIATSGTQESSAIVIHTGSGNNLVKVEVVSNPIDLEKGLMNRTHLDGDSGMLFVFPYESKWSFWMKNTLIPLDMIYVNSRLKIVDITTMQPCKADPCPDYNPIAQAKYVLEVNAGYSAAHNITIGDEITSDTLTPSQVNVVVK